MAASLVLSLAASPARAAEATQTAGDQLEEIVVTARYQKENLQQTPISITALTGDDLERKGYTNIVDISRQVPNLKYDANQGAYGNSASVFIRGVGQGDFNFAFDPGVAVYVDNVYFGTLYGNQLDLTDTESIDVLLGPQGTLFGRNTEGGAISVHTVEPKGDGSGYAEVGYGSYNHEQFRGAFDAAIIPDKLFLRVAAGVSNQDGYVDVIDYACAHPAQAAALGLKASTTAPGCKVGELGGGYSGNYHGALRFLPTDDLEINLTADVLDQKGEEAASDTIYINPRFPGSYGFLAKGYSSAFLTGDPYKTYMGFSDTTNGYSFPNESDTRSWGVAGTVDYQTPWGIHIKDIASYRSYDGTFSVFLGGSPITLDANYNSVSHHQFSNETQFSGKLLDGTLDWTAGAYFYTAYSKYAALVDLPPFGLVFNQNDPVVDHNTSGFLHTVYHLDDQFSIEAGLRYSTEDKSYTFFRQDALTGKPLWAYAGYGLTIGPYTSASQRFDPKIAFQYQWTPDVMTYATVSTGYKGGGINPRPSTPAQLQTFKPEDLTAFEIGAKSQWLDNRLRLNGDIFVSDYKQLQTGYVAPGSAGSVILNTGHVILYGTELTLAATPMPHLQVDSTASWLHNKTVATGAAGECVTGTIYALDKDCQLNGVVPGQRIGGIPAWKVNLGLQYSYDLPADTGILVPRLDWHYQGTTYFTSQSSFVQTVDSAGRIVATPEPVLGRQPGYSTVDARLSYNSPDGDWEAAFSVHNLTDQFYYLNEFGLLSSYGNLDATPSLPRTYMFTVKRNFAPAAAPAPYAPPPAPAAAVQAPAPATPAPEMQRSFQVFFDFDKADVTDAAAKVIQAAADTVKAGGVVRITVTGHTDTVGSARYDQALSERRAAAVKVALVADGVAEGEITAKGVGKSGLLVPTADGVREPQNRRVEIALD